MSDPQIAPRAGRINLPRLGIAHANHASAVVGSGNRVFAIYQVDALTTPFWVVELGYNRRPLRPAERFTSHGDALACLANLARAAVGVDALS